MATWAHTRGLCASARRDCIGVMFFFCSVGVIVCGFVFETSDPHDVAAGMVVDGVFLQRGEAQCGVQTWRSRTCNLSAALRAWLVQVA